MTIPSKPAAFKQDENVDYFILGEDTLYFSGEGYDVLPKGDVMELPTVCFEKELR